MPYFSIILPTYNRAHLLAKAIDSVLEQTYVDWELIIVDDGSTDNTKELVTAYKDDRILYIYQENQERSIARNNGIKHARGEYVCFLDSDDYFLKDKLLRFYEVSRGMETIKLFYDAMAFEKDGELGPFHLPLKKKDETLHEFLLMNPLVSMQLCIPAVGLKLEQFNPSLRIGEDSELWLRLANSYEFNAVKSNNTIVLEHGDRSVNFFKNNIGLEQRKQLSLIFRIHNKSLINSKFRRSALSNCYFNIARYYMTNVKYIPAIKWILISIFVNVTNYQTKHRFYCLFFLIQFKVPREYRL